MRIVVNDANILIDLVDLGLLPHFFSLEFEFLTTSLVLDELYEEQQEALLPYVDSEVLIVQEMEEDDLEQIIEIQQSKPKLSQQDCSAFYQAQKNEGTLLTSDNSLRKFALEQEIDVHGHLWVFDCMVEAETISQERASEKLKELCEVVNPKLNLPKKECDKRFNDWQSEE